MFHLKKERMKERKKERMKSKAKLSIQSIKTWKKENEEVIR
jgi:hypothetical protein